MSMQSFVISIANEAIILYRANQTSYCPCLSLCMVYNGNVICKIEGVTEANFPDLVTFNEKRRFKLHIHQIKRNGKYIHIYIQKKKKMTNFDTRSVQSFNHILLY